MIKTVLVIRNYSEREFLSKSIRRDNRFQLLGALDSFQSLIDLTNRTNIDCVICESTAKDMDYIECSQRLKYKIGDHSPRFIVLCSSISSSSFERMLSLGATDVLRSNINTTHLMDRIASVVQDDSQLMLRESVAKYNQPESEIKRWLMKLEISPKLLGHKYLTSAIEFCIGDPDMLYNVSKNLYVEIAHIYDTKPENVERAIRHSIDVMWKNASSRYINELFNNPMKANCRKPTNCELLAAIYEKVSEVRIHQETPRTREAKEPQYT